MQIRHINCMTFMQREQEISHCLLVETAQDGLVLVDTGLGIDDYAHPAWRVRLLTSAYRVPCDQNETALRQVRALGHDPRDVRHIVLTHLHSDHSGGLPDFPWAKIHVYEKEYQAAMRPRRWHALDLVGYEPAHWKHGPDWAIHAGQPWRWMGLDCLPVLGNQDGGILLVPLEGHTPGHCGVAVSSPEGWLLHCGDAFVRAMHVDALAPRSPFPGWFAPIEGAMFPVGARKRVRRLLQQHADEVRVFCSHDPHVFAQMRER